jgi:hypothetical protein
MQSNLQINITLFYSTGLWTVEGKLLFLKLYELKNVKI